MEETYGGMYGGSVYMYMYMYIYIYLFVCMEFVCMEEAVMLKNNYDGAYVCSCV